ncbi:MAG: branched-chain amino acid ABC transporter permease [Desulfuromonadaceae bacterium]|nr:branched-chain amino acid ABC transporter permease [Desulfuromonadaceae bacterium]
MNRFSIFTNRRGASHVAPIAFIVIVCLLFALPGFMESPYLRHIMILLFLSVIMGESWNLIGGYAGQYSVGHAAYFGAGAYGTMIVINASQFDADKLLELQDLAKDSRLSSLLLSAHNLPPWSGIIVGMIAALILSLIIGSICFRLRGPYFVLASIAVAEIVRLTVLNLADLTQGAEGILISTLPPFTIGNRVITDFSSKVPFYYIGLILALLTILVTWVVQNSKLGYLFQAIREDQDAAHSLGISPTFYKNTALALSAVLTSLAGSFYAIYIKFIDPTTVLSLDLSVQIVLISIIGGIGTIFGPVVGALVLVPLSEVLRSNLIGENLISSGMVSADSAFGTFLTENLSHAHVLIYGILVVVVILFMPDGVLGFFKSMVTKKRKEAA